jgi:carbonic anhydrase/acetyltransferase-like protein (isoleucine patch superfamily)
VEKTLYIFGCSGIGKSICDSLCRGAQIYDEIMFVDVAHERFKGVFYGYKVLSIDDFEEIRTEGAHAIFAFFKPSNIFDRDILIDEVVSKKKLQLISIIDPSAVVSDSARVGVGTYVAPNVLIDSDVRIGENCIILFNSVISREVEIAGNCFISAGCVLKGSVSIKKSSFISANVSVAKSIHEEAFVNAGVVLTEEIRETSIVSAERTLIKLLLPNDKKKAKKRLRYLHP